MPDVILSRLADGSDPPSRSMGMKPAVWVSAWLVGLTAACGGSSGEDRAPAGVAGSSALTAGSGGTVAATGAGAGSAVVAGSAGAAGAGTAGVGAAAGTGMGGVGASGASGANAGASGAGQGGATAAGSGGASAVTGPTLPAIDDPGANGPFTVDRVDTVSGLTSHSLFVPDAVGSHGKHPVVVWTCGNGGSVSFYESFLDHLASHGFLVVADKASSSDRLAEVASQKAAIDWLLAENAKQGGDFSGKIDLDHIAVMGHSLGSLASFATAAQNEHVATSIHYSGGLTGNPVGFDESWLADMTKPAAFLCGGADGTAGPSCAMDFEKAPATLPVFYGVLAGASHIGPFGGTPRAGQYGRAGVAWLRWRLAGDAAFASWFVGPTCTLCASPWTAQKRNLQ
jgi:dienelactone hydrolase